jgi:tetratricopeptide (TPR) repeat protein
MKVLFLLINIALCFCIHNCKAQDADSYFNKGLIEYNLGNYKNADSLYTLSLNIQYHADVFFNRAFSRKMLNDYKGYCNDLYETYNLYDIDAEKLFFKHCGKKHITYKTKDNLISDSLNYFFKEIQILSQIIELNSLSRYNNEDSLILAYSIIQNDTVYGIYPKEGTPQYIGGTENHEEDLKTALKSNQIYKEKRDNYPRTSYNMKFVLIINESGDVISVSRISPHPVEDFFPELTKEIENILISVGKYTPAHIGGRKIKCKHVESIWF